ncbi:sugar phosphate isomerase/epimerase family protein [Anaerolentibacter hominis]|uniref:sugar phosphate isomerase/epimerase family protein n=1 Tax=Anaerolentibacter hominis TaxID=3079009 RepID=UPI0031B86882
MKYATRINSFLGAGDTISGALEKIGRISGIEYVDLNYPEHFQELPKEQMKEKLAENNLKVSAVNLRFRKKFRDGEFGNIDEEISRDAVKLCREAIQVCEYLEGTQIIIWLGYDGYDYSFQIQYEEVWDKLVAAFREICAATSLPVSIEYKPYEERVHAYLDSYGTTRLMVQEVGKQNLGMTLDFCHMLMKGENPAFAAAMLLRDGKLFTVHLNDGEGNTDDGLIVGSVHLWKTVELFYYLKKYEYDGIIYFDTFPKIQHTEEECRANVDMCRRIEEMIGRVGLDYIADVIRQNSVPAIAAMMSRMLAGEV